MSVCQSMNCRAPKIPNRMKSTEVSIMTKTPFVAARFAPSKSFAPSDRESSALMPTPVPVAKAIIRFWIGKARETAVSAASLTRATKTESTTL